MRVAGAARRFRSTRSTGPSDGGAAVPLVSIVMPLFNMAATLRASVDSCLAQTLSDFELLVVDDGSDRATADLASSLSERDVRISYRRIEHTGKPGVVRNVGVQAAMGDYVQFLDADDLIAPQKLASQVKTLERCASGTVAYSDYLMFWEARGRRRFKRLGPSHAQHWPANLAKQFSMYTVLHRFLFPRHVLSTARFDERLTHAEDLDLWLRLLIRGTPFVYLPTPLAYYRQHRSHSVGNPGAEVSSRAQVVSNCRGYLAEAALTERYENDLACMAELAERPAWAVAHSNS